MIRLIKKNIVRGITSYDVYFGEERTNCSVIVRTPFEPLMGRYRLEILDDVIVIRHLTKGWRVGEIRAGNGVYGRIGCVMHCGVLTAGVLCTNGHYWFDGLREYIVNNGNELVISPPVPGMSGVLAPESIQMPWKRH